MKRVFCWVMIIGGSRCDTIDAVGGSTVSVYSLAGPRSEAEEEEAGPELTWVCKIKVGWHFESGPAQNYPVVLAGGPDRDWLRRLSAHPR
jgi:hypothetical protein